MPHTRHPHTEQQGLEHPHGHHLHEGHPEVTRREVVAGAIGLGLASACSSDDPSADGASLEAKGPYPIWNNTTRDAYTRTTPDGKTGQYKAGYVGDKTLPGGTFGRYRAARVGAVTGAELWATRNGRHLTIGGGEYSSDSAAVLKIPSPASITLDAPLEIDLDATIGAPQAVALKAKLALGGSDITSGAANGSYTVLGRDVSAEGPSGVSIAGCTHLRMDLEVPIFFGATSVSAHAQFWYSPTLGVVKVALDAPLSGLGLGVQGSRGSHDLGDGYASVEAMEVVGKGAQPRFVLSTTEAAGTLDADKETHAKMLVELRWADEATAKTDKRPSVQPAFGTNTGTFPATLTQASVSFLHPEENGKGYVTWYFYVDQAAKNQPTNPIEYHSGISYDSSGSPLRVTSRIVYKRA